MEENIRILKPYLRGFPIIVLGIILGVLAAKKYLSYTTPMYESTTKIRLADVGESVPNSNLFKDFDIFANTTKITTEIEVLKSQVLMDKVLKELDFDTEIYRVGKIKSIELYENSPFKLQYHNLSEKAYDRPFDLILFNNNEYQITLPDNGKTYNGKIGESLETNLGNFVVSLNDSLIVASPGLQIADHYSVEILSHQKLYSKISKNLDIISVDKDVPVIRISYKHASPIKAAKLANKLAEVYINDYIETKYKAANVTVGFLDNQINNIVAKLSNSENQIQNYRDGKSITNLTQETETDLRKISQLKIQQTNVKMNLEAIQDLEQYIGKGKNNFLDLAPNFEAFTDLLSTEIVKKIKALQAEKKDLLITFTKEDEKVKVIDEKIKDLTDYLTESITNTRKNLAIKYQNLSNDINEAEKVFIGVPEKEKMLNILNREFNLYQQSYNFLNEKKIEAEIAKAAKIAFHRIISPAEISKEPVSPNKTIITIVSALIGMFLSIFLIAIVHLLKAKVNDLHTIETNSTIPVSILTPKLNNEIAIRKHFLKEAIQLEIKGLVKEKNNLCFTAYNAKEGADFNAFHFARAFAAQGIKVLFLDVDNQLNNKDWQKTENIEIRTLADASYDLYTPAKMKTMLNQLKEDYDLLIVLNECLVNDTKAKMLMSIADTNFVVLDTRLTPEKRILETDIMKEEYQFPAMHFLLNRYGYNPSLFGNALKYIIKPLRTMLPRQSSKNDKIYRKIY